MASVASLKRAERGRLGHSEHISYRSENIAGVARTASHPLFFMAATPVPLGFPYPAPNPLHPYLNHLTSYIL